MAVLPQHLPLQPGNWNPLNDFLSVGHNADGTLKNAAGVINVKDEAYGAKGDDSTDDTAAIQAAITAAGTSDTIYFPKGTYRVKTAGAFNSAVQLGSKKISFLSQGAVIKADPASATGIHLISMTGTDQVIEGIEFDCNGISQATATFLSNTSRTTIRKCLFTNPQTAGVWIVGTTSDLSVIDNKFIGAGYGVLADAASTCTRVLIEGNRFMGGSSGLVGDAIEINTPTGGATDVSCVGNIINGYTNAANIGIGYAHVVDGVISGNVITTIGLDGIHLEDGTTGITVTGNKVSGCSRSGISVNSGNVARLTTDNIVKANIVHDCNTGSGSGGIAFEGTQGHKGHVISGNRVKGCGRAAATVDGILVGGLTVKECSVIGNVVSNTIGTTTSGIHVSNGTDVVVTGNRCYDDQGGKTQAYGVKTDGSSDFITLANNDVVGNLTGGMSLVGSNNSVGDNMGFQIHGVKTLSYSGTIATDASLGDVFPIVATNGTAFTISNPTNLQTDMVLTYDIKNSSGGAIGAITWGATFLNGGAGTVGTGAFAGIANGKRRTISFYYDGTNLIELSRTADI